ncbi:hypothetical protein [Umezakia ovalisporum]|jgi:hypothetical protein|uniref:Uncharacterized protein n=2 Tax=Umezakia ovalisporum TaxID=75695 RepID=A0ABT6K3N9_9CYAN|nr:hypothetical protein [Umezakia ovalisporum]MDH6056934.1 hypothetical protein [Umezakia ovalisporum FSS-43]MDH6068384.1 hypothetical protein [Umezakia ovalisporum APH033B]MDH6071125.1 hypothetical protein [Umezakia ovalisporum CobakiLakeA]MDH6074850.1 hypothetical protein [Umezakia ovalisporum CS-1034]MDH6081928.1 hypothetical protein [Umezakia ovalisporum FSS-44]
MKASSINLSGSLNLENVRVLTMGEVTTTGGVNILARSPVIQTDNITATADINIIARESAGNDDYIIIRNGVNVRTRGGNIVLQAGEDVTLEDNWILEVSSGDIVMEADLGTAGHGNQNTTTAAGNDRITTANGGDIIGIQGDNDIIKTCRGNRTIICNP